MSNGLAIAALCIEVVGIIVTIWLAIYTIIISSRQRETERKQTKYDSMEEDLKKGAASMLRAELALIEQKIEGKVSGTLGGMGTQLTELRTMVTMFDQRFRSGDGHFKATDDRLQKLEIDLVKQMGELMERVATKEDLRQLREDMRSDK